MESRRGTSWELEDDVALLAKHKQGFSVEQLACQFNRSPKAIHFRLAHLQDPTHYAHLRMERHEKDLCKEMNKLSLSEKPGPKRLYVLQLEEGKFYVGTTEKSAQERLQDHLSQPTQWTAKYKPLALIREECPYRPFSEDAVTLELMQRYGVEQVRGGRFASLILSSEQIRAILASIAHEEGRCFTCGGNHFSHQCQEK
jgi:predicted GIY-YIG superfamily endonuclease